jgi:6-phosphogluconolactonase
MRKTFVVTATLILSLLFPGCGGFFDDPGNGGGGGGGTTPRFVFAANFTGGTGTGTVSSFTVNSSSGALTALNTSFNAGTGPTGIASDPKGKFVFVANQGGGVSAFTVDRTTTSSAGTLTAITNSPFPTGTNPVSVVVDPKANFIYVANGGSNDISAYTMDSSSGNLTAFASTISLAGTPKQVRIDPNGRFLYAALGTVGVQVFKINADGTLTSVTTVAPAPCAGASDVAVDPDTRFAYIADGNTGICAYAINANSGGLSLINQSIIPSATKPVALVVNPNGKQLFVVNNGANNVSAFTLNVDGTVTAVSSSPFASGAQPSAIAVDPSEKFVYVTNSGDGTVSVYSISSSGGLSAGTTVNAGQDPAAIAGTP